MDGTGGWKGYDISKIFNSEYSASSVLIGSLNSSYRLLGSIKCFLLMRDWSKRITKGDIRGYHPNDFPDVRTLRPLR